MDESDAVTVLLFGPGPFLSILLIYRSAIVNTTGRSLVGHFATVLLVGSMMVGCDQVSPGAQEQGTPPVVSELTLRPDSVNAAELPAEQAQDSLAEIAIAIVVRAKDSDGTVERVQFTIEPASNPRGTAAGRLRELNGNLYGQQIGLQIPSFRDEVYTVRVFAVDNDSLASNQSIGQFRFVPAP